MYRDWVACGHCRQHDQRQLFAQPAANDGRQPFASDAVKLTMMLPGRRQQAVGGEGSGRPAEDQRDGLYERRLRATMSKYS